MENSPTEFQHKKCSQKWPRDFSSYMKYNAIEGAFLIWAATWQNQQNVSASSEDSDQPGHPPSLIRVFAVRMKKPIWFCFIQIYWSKVLTDQPGRCQLFRKYKIVKYLKKSDNKTGDYLSTDRTWAPDGLVPICTHKMLCMVPVHQAPASAHYWAHIWHLTYMYLLIFLGI